MTDREQAKVFIDEEGYGCPSVKSCRECIANHCDADRKICIDKAAQWLADHPEEPKAETKKDTSLITKSAGRGDEYYSVSLFSNRINVLHRKEGKGYETIDFEGTIEDFNRFVEFEPESWFSEASEILYERNNSWRK